MARCYLSTAAKTYQDHSIATTIVGLNNGMNQMQYIYNLQNLGLCLRLQRTVLKFSLFNDYDMGLVREPTSMFEFFALVATEELSINFATKNGLIAVTNEMRGSRKNDSLRPFFSIILDEESKLPVQSCLYILYFWATGTTLQHSVTMLQIEILKVAFWYNHISDVATFALRDAEPMGGPGHVVEIDESLVRDRGRSNITNDRVVGPWIFGIVLRRPNEKPECRLFHVLRRNERTLRALIQANVARGSTIITDDWCAYNNISDWSLSDGQSAQFTHQVVNRWTKPVDCHWRHLSKRVRETPENLRPGLLSAYWWRRKHSKTPLVDLLRDVRRFFPIME